MAITTENSIPNFSVDSNDLKTGLVLRSIGNLAEIKHEENVRRISIPGKWKLTSRGSKPLVPGDIVKISIKADEWRIISLCERRNHFTRKFPGPRTMPQTVASNLDRVIVVASCSQPKTPFGLIDRLLVTAALGGVPAVLLINKIDLCSSDKINEWRRVFRHSVEDIFETSALKKIGLDVLYDLLPGQTTLFAGSSGVGKSSLVNHIDPELNLKTGEVSRVTGKGRHITSASRFYPLGGGGWIVDTPGLRECAPWGMTKSNLANTYKEISDLNPQCKFRDCRHVSEIGCVVKEIVGTELFTVERYESYCKLMRETEN